jgi:hypothetical protein
MVHTKELAQCQLQSACVARLANEQAVRLGTCEGVLRKEGWSHGAALDEHTLKVHMLGALKSLYMYGLQDMPT